MHENNANMGQLLDRLADLLDIPPSHYEQATERYQSLGEWFHRDGSEVAAFDPAVYAQGSFAYGTVIRPLLTEDEYDLDLVCTLRQLSKPVITQKYLKEMVGQEIKAYAIAHNMKSPAQEGKRCWRLDYADDVSFHMDILPDVPDDQKTIRALVDLGVNLEHARHAIAITDKTHPRYAVISDDWCRSNPKGYAQWFQGRMRAAAEPRIQSLVQRRIYASVDDVPVYEWKTPLQRAIQILKRHRDVVFRERPDAKPISMIVTTLAAHAYGGEADLYKAIVNIIDGMPDYIRDREPRIPNPVNPAEDFADQWRKDPKRERGFWEWHAQVKADVGHMIKPGGPDVFKRLIERRFSLTLSEEKIRGVLPEAAAASVAPTVHIRTPARPWRRSG
jgi:hypothetical protein